MRISTRGRYSLEALLYLSLLPVGDFASTKSISENTGISDGYLEQLFIPLKKDGLLRGIRGAQGGYVLGKPAADIRVGDILRAVEGSLAPVTCLSGDTCESETKCPTRHTWSDLYHEITDCIDSITLEDLDVAYSKLDQQEYAI